MLRGLGSSQLYRAYFNRVTTGTNVPLILGFVPVVWRFVLTVFIVLLNREVKLLRPDASLNMKMHKSAFSVRALPRTPLGSVTVSLLPQTLTGLRDLPANKHFIL